MDTFQIPYFVFEEKLNPDVPHQYEIRYGNFEEYEKAFFDITNGKHYAKQEYLDMISHVNLDKVSIGFVVENDATVAGRRYQELYFCQTPLCYAYNDYMMLFNEKIPKVRQRNDTRTSLEPLIPEVCAKFLVLNALIESVIVNGQKNITMTITSKTIKMSYTYDPKEINDEIISTKRKYFDVFGIDVNQVYKDYSEYEKQHRLKLRNSYLDGIKTYEILFNVRATTFKKYAVLDDQLGLLTKAEYDIHKFLKDRGGSSLRLISDEFGYKSPRAAKYHVDKLIKRGLVQRIGANKSHNCFYRAAHH